MKNKIKYYSKTEYNIIKREIYDVKTYDHPAITLNEDPVIFDIGANIGLYSVYMKEKHPLSSIYSFEPLKFIFRHLRQNVSNAVNMGFSDHEHEAVLYSPFFTSVMATTDMSHHGSFSQVRNIALNLLGKKKGWFLFFVTMPLTLFLRYFGISRHKCRMTTFSKFVEEKEITRIDLVKIDVEGHELKVLQGIDDQHWDMINFFVLEVHNVGDNMQQIIELFNEKQFNCEISQDKIHKNTIYHTFYVRRMEA